MQQPEIKLYDLYDIWYESLLSQWWVIAVLVFVGALCVGLCLWFVIRKIKQKAAVPAWQQALRSFEQLQAETYLQAEKSQEFYLQLSAILKEYLQDRYQVALCDKTDQELLQFFGSSEVLDAFAAEMDQVLQGATMVKFAQQRAALETMKRDLAFCSSLVEKTKPPLNA